MAREIPFRSWLPALLLGVAAAATGACGGGGGGGGPTSPPPPTVNPGVASFRLVGAGYDETVSYGGGTGLVFCRRAGGFADLWLRFAEESAANGENGPHLDIDLCNPGGGGTFDPMDAQAGVCPGGQTWDVWWHSDGDTFVNPAMAPGCTLTLTRSGSELSGTFSCRGMVELGGAGRLDLLDGTFRCTET
ncbi:MAG TPA: hypothetical protein VLF66_20395 [Thermoanaerobaculia bacterium]|nr:hypothetical protein [Thermoanaerobaculia bacterium]